MMSPCFADGLRDLSTFQLLSPLDGMKAHDVHGQLTVQ